MLEDCRNVFNDAGVMEAHPLHCNFKDGKAVDICSIKKDYYKYLYKTSHELILHQHKGSGHLVMIARQLTPSILVPQTPCPSTPTS